MLIVYLSENGINRYFSTNFDTAHRSLNRNLGSCDHGDGYGGFLIQVLTIYI